MKGSFELKEIFNIKPSIIYNAWLYSEEHSKMTGGEACCGDKIGDKFSAWDGYIQGKNLKLISNQEIGSSWSGGSIGGYEDSKLIIRFKEIESGTALTLIHSNIPEGQTQYKQGWIDHYFIPMKQYFENKK